MKVGEVGPFQTLGSSSLEIVKDRPDKFLSRQHEQILSMGSGRGLDDPHFCLWLVGLCCLEGMTCLQYLIFNIFLSFLIITNTNRTF